jgi:asparaginyl-tRNA synthetase
MDYRRSYIRDIFQLDPGTEASAYGWVKTRRDSKGISFIQLSDGSCFKDLQVIVEAGVIEEETLKRITTGACVRFDGTVVESPAAGQAVELKAAGVELFGEADPKEYPLQKKGATMEFLREIAHLRARGNTFGAVFRVRNQAAQAIHRFFDKRGFHYIQTPVITASDAEGAGAMFQVTTQVETVEPLDGDGSVAYRLKGSNPADDFFGKPSYLTVSGQLEAETLALGMTNVYTFGPTFRAENSNTARHLAEFWMIEPEIAFADLNDNASLAEDFLKYLFKAVLDERMDDMKFFAERQEKTAISRLEAFIAAPFERIDYTQAIEILKNSGHKFEFPVEWGHDLQTEHERYLTEKHVGRPVVVMNYPEAIKAFYMRLNDDGKTVAAMDVLAPGIGEIIGGSQREERLDYLDRRMAQFKLDPAHYQWYRDFRRYGTVPHSGFGLGFERLVVYVCGLTNIRDAIPYPRVPGYAEF